MGEKPTGTSQETDEEDVSDDAAMKAAGASKAAGGAVAGEAGRAEGSISTTRSNIKSGGGS